MNTKTLNRANEIKREIETYEAEISQLEYRKGCRYTGIRKLLSNPKKQTYKHLWSLEEVDSIRSTVLIRHDELDLMIGHRKLKVMDLKKELESL
ncbi:MAG: hypothetical protein K0S76_457 [Herbinix sp.]|jgi:hypothetical protein|nr:hypothetical protein [Herbinix sp.]